MGERETGSHYAAHRIALPSLELTTGLLPPSLRAGIKVTQLGTNLMPSIIADLEQAGGGTPRALSPLLVIYSAEVALKGLHKSRCLSFQDVKKLKMQQPKQDIREDRVLL